MLRLWFRVGLAVGAEHVIGAQGQLVDSPAPDGDAVIESKVLEMTSQVIRVILIRILMPER